MPSRDVILDAAERLFAERGYAATSLHEVGQAAGLSRAAPGYFFGSKAELYRAVLDRCLAEARQAVASGRDRALASGKSPRRILAAVVADYYDFLRARPRLVRLLEREALGDGPGGIAVPARAAGEEALAAIMAELGLSGRRSREAAHLLVSLVALCWFPLVHGQTLLPTVGLDPRAPAYAEERKRHVVDLILQGAAPHLRRAKPRARRSARTATAR